MEGSFQAFVDEGYIKVMKQQVIQGQQQASRKDILCLTLDQVLCCDTYFTFPSDLARKLSKGTLSSNDNTIVMPCALKHYLNEDKSNIKIMVLEKDFLDSDGDIPSGNNLDDLFKHIWNHIWNSFQIQKKKKELVKKMTMTKKTRSSCTSVK